MGDKFLGYDDPQSDHIGQFRVGFVTQSQVANLLI